MPIREGNRDAPVVGKGCEQNMKMEDLMRREKVIEGSGSEPLRHPICTAGKTNRKGGRSVNQTSARTLLVLVRSYLLQQCPGDVQRSGRQQPFEAHLVAQLREPVREQPLCHGHDATQAQANEDLRPGPSVRRLAVFRVQHDVRGGCGQTMVVRKQFDGNRWNDPYRSRHTR